MGWEIVEEVGTGRTNLHPAGVQSWILGVTARSRFVIALALGLGPLASSAPASPTFDKDAALILFKNCAKCHRPGEIASTIPLLSYETARPWAKSIKEKVLSRQMPPWGADPNASMKFRNDPRLSQRDIDTLAAWVNSGAPKGNDRDLPPLPEFPQGWLHPSGVPPDIVLSSPDEIQIPARGEIPYIRYLVKVPFAEDKWVAAAQVRPGNRAVVHHMAITELKLDDGVTPADLDEMARLSKLLGVPNQLTKSRPAVTAPGDPRFSTCWECTCPAPPSKSTARTAPSC